MNAIKSGAGSITLENARCKTDHSPVYTWVLWRRRRYNIVSSYFSPNFEQAKRKIQNETAYFVLNLILYYGISSNREFKCGNSQERSKVD